MLLDKISNAISNLLGSKKNLPNICDNEDTIFVDSPKDEKSYIPDNIRKLLWFANGPFKNYVDKPVQKKCELGGFSYIFTSSSTEPSLIDMELPIIEPGSEPVEPLSYFPSYKDLTPQQRWTYLNWIKDVSNPIDIGYVFILYYGIERHLFFGDYENAYKLIFELREKHKNSSFLTYSGNAIIASALLRDRADLFLSYVENTVDTDELFINDLYLFAKYLLKMELSASEIILMASSVGFTNRRYIKNQKSIFIEKLQEELQKKFGCCYFPLLRFNLNDCEIVTVTIMANYSLSEDERLITIPSLLSCSSFKESIYTLLQSTHEAVKQHLAQMRKTHQESSSDKKKLSSESKEIIYTDLSFSQEIKQQKVNLKNSNVLHPKRSEKEEKRAEDFVKKCMMRYALDPEYHQRKDKFFIEFFDVSNRMVSSNDAEQQFAYGEKALTLLEKAVWYFMEDDGFLPPSIYCRDILPELYMSYGRWEDAERVIKTCAEIKAYGHEETINEERIWVPQDGSIQLEELNQFHEVSNVATDFISKNPGYLQRNIYKELKNLDHETLKRYLHISKLIKKEAFQRTYKLFLNDNKKSNL